MSVDRIPFNRPWSVGSETAHIAAAIAGGHLSGHGPYAERCSQVLAELTGAASVLMTPSCSAALEMAVILAGIGPGDEVIMPSYTFVSTANAVALRGGVPVFTDIREDTLNVDERLIEAAITPRTKALIVVHYGAVAARMPQIMEIAAAHGLLVIEDAAHCIRASLDGRELGSFGDLATFSFHETKNVHCGEGGALVVNREDLVARAEIVQDKGTNRSRFLRGQVDKYTWVDIGSSYLPSEVACAFLFAQLERADDITARRLRVWDAYHERLVALERERGVGRPVVPEGCVHNGHLYFLILSSAPERDAFIGAMAARGIHTVFHYVPLHRAPAAAALARSAGALDVTEDRAARLVRLPIWPGMSENDVERVIAAAHEAVAETAGTVAAT